MRRGITFLSVGWLALAVATTAEANGIYKTSHQSCRVETFFEELNHPWGLAFLPDGRMLVTERAGQLNLLDPANGSRTSIKGVPEVVATGHGGLLDIAHHPDFESNCFVYLSYTAADGGYATHVGRGWLQGDKVRDFGVLFIAVPLAASVLGYPKNLLSQQVLSKEQRTMTVVIENLEVQRDRLSGELRNRSSHRVRDVELLIRHVWLWNNEFRPGKKDPGMAVYHRGDKEIPPGGSVPFTHKFSAPPPERADGAFETVVSASGFAEIIPQ